jgi:hypothetical protein
MHGSEKGFPFAENPIPAIYILEKINKKGTYANVRPGARSAS